MSFQHELLLKTISNQFLKILQNSARSDSLMAPALKRLRGLIAIFFQHKRISKKLRDSFTAYRMLVIINLKSLAFLSVNGATNQSFYHYCIIGLIVFRVANTITASQFAKHQGDDVVVSLS